MNYCLQIKEALNYLEYFGILGIIKLKQLAGTICENLWVGVGKLVNCPHKINNPYK